MAPRQEPKINTPTARLNNCQPRREPYWRSIGDKGLSLGYRRGVSGGTWIAKHYGAKHGKRYAALGTADDRDAKGKPLSYAEAQQAARAWLSDLKKQDKAEAENGQPTGKEKEEGAYTVAKAMRDYIDSKRAEGKPVEDLVSRTRAHILPSLGKKVVSELETRTLRTWLAKLAETPARKRSKRGKTEYSEQPTTDEDARRRKSSANRVLTILKAALNQAYDEKKEAVPTNEAWGRRLKPFENVDAARIGYLTLAEAKRLANACDSDFRALVRAALETGARYGELARMVVGDFKPDSGTVFIRKSKSGKPRHVVLTEDGVEFFRERCPLDQRNALIFTHDGGSAWKKSEQFRRIREACAEAEILPVISFHQLRHTWASHAVMNKVPLMVVAQNLGHADTRMVERHYGHLAESYVADEIRKGAPRFGFETKRVVVAAE
jgi:integrase